MVLDCIVGAPREELGDLSPTVPESFVSLENFPVLLIAPRILVDVGIEVVVPALAALLSDAAGEVTSNERPLLRAVLAHERDDLEILFGGPWPLDQRRFQDFLPSVEALLGVGWGWGGAGWGEVGWSGVEWSGVEWSGVEWSGVEWSGVGYEG